MYRQSIVKAARPALRLQSSAIRTFTTTQRVMAEGDLGATRATGYVRSRVYPCCWEAMPHLCKAGQHAALWSEVLAS